MDAFPSRTDELLPGEAIRQAFGAWPWLIGGGLFVTAVLVRVGRDEALGIPNGFVTRLAFTVVAGAILGADWVRRDKRVTLAIRGSEIAVYRKGALFCVRPIGAITSILLDVGSSLRNLLCSLGAALIPGVVAVRESGVAQAAGFVWSAVFLAGALSVVHTRFRCRHFWVPVGDRNRRIAIRAEHGDKLLTALPRTGNWQVAE